MAFMALFGWIFIPIILVGLLCLAFVNAVSWAVAHAALIYAVVGVVLAVNVLIFFVLLRLRAKWKRENHKGRWFVLLGCFWQFLVIFFWGAFLLIRPLQYIPPHFGEVLTVKNVFFDEWEIVGCQGTLPGYSCSQETLEQYVGLKIRYAENSFTSNGQTFALSQNEPYLESVRWRESSISLPNSSLVASFDDLGIERKNVRSGRANFMEPPGEPPVGWFFLILDYDTLAVYHNCLFFQAKRVE